MDRMHRWERILILFFILVIVVILLAVSSRLMEDRMDFEIGARYALLIGYLTFGGWVALRKGKQLGMVRKRVRNRPLQLVGWFLGLFVVFSVVTPWQGRMYLGEAEKIGRIKLAAAVLIVIIASFVLALFSA